MDAKMGNNKVVIREFNGDKDVEVVMKLEKNCEAEAGSRKGVSIISNTNGDPLSRIRFYHVRVMLVAELQKNREVVGMVRGCIKCVGTKLWGGHVKLGCILGLRVSPRHRRMGIGLKLVQSVEEWMMRNGAQYTFLATEEKNVASRNLFTRCNYIKSSSLFLHLQPLSFLSKNPTQPQDIKIERLTIDHAISFYNKYLQSKDIYPADIDTILKDELSLGSWVSYFKEEGQIGLMHNKEKRGHEIETPRSWAIFSIWNTSEAYKIQVRSSHELKFFHSSLSQARDKIFPCLKMPRSSSCQSLEKPFGFLFLYGIHGEGEKVGELMESMWGFASRLAENLEDCKAIMIELGVSDPVREFVPKGSTMSCIDDIWYFKRAINGPSYDDGGLTGGTKGTLLGNVFVDPRDF